MLSDKKPDDKKSERDYLRERVIAPQSTHDLVPNNSAGMALRALVHYYWPSPDQKKIEEEFKHCAEELKKEAPKDKQLAVEFILKKTQEPPGVFDIILTLAVPLHLKVGANPKDIKPGDLEEYKLRLMTDSKLEEGTLYIEKKDKDALQYTLIESGKKIIATIRPDELQGYVITDPLNLEKLKPILLNIAAARNHVTLRKEVPPPVFPLRDVLLLVWKGLHDDAKFTHAYKGSPEEKLKQAQADRPKRLSPFFGFLEGMRIAGLCHQGDRNDLVGSLLPYEGMDLIEDARLLVGRIVKETVSEKFWEKYRDEKNVDKASLTYAFCHWMEYDDAGPIFAKVDPDHTLKIPLRQLFIRHGSDPVDGKLDQIFDDALKYGKMPFVCNPQEYPILDRMHFILSHKDNNNKALATAKEWLKTKFKFGNKEDENSLNRFWFMCRLHQDLMQSRVLFILTGSMTPALIHAFKTCEDYMQGCKDKPHYPALSKETLAIVEALPSIIKKCKKDSMSDVIENFFAKWFIAVPSHNVLQLKSLYKTFISFSEEYKEKALLTDEKLHEFFSESKIEAGAIDLDPYIINRIFLHAIIVEPEKWTPVFKQRFEKTLAFVANSFNQPAIGIAGRLMQDSYQLMLIHQLKDLIAPQPAVDETDAKAMEESTRAICLPLQCRIAAEWAAASHILDEKQRDSFYSKDSKRIDQLLRKVIMDENISRAYSDIGMSIIYLIDSLPINRRLPFLKTIDKKELQNRVYPSPSFTWPAFTRFLLLLPDKESQLELVNFLDRKVMFHSFKLNQLTTLLTQAREQNNQLDWLAILGEDVIRDALDALHAFESVDHLGNVLRALPEDNHLHFLNMARKEQLKELEEVRKESLALFEKELALLKTEARQDITNWKREWITSRMESLVNQINDYTRNINILRNVIMEQTKIITTAPEAKQPLASATTAHLPSPTRDRLFDQNAAKNEQPPTDGLTDKKSEPLKPKAPKKPAIGSDDSKKTVLHQPSQTHFVPTVTVVDDQSKQDKNIHYVFIISRHAEVDPEHKQYRLSHAESFDNVKKAAEHWARVEGQQFDDNMLVKLNIPKEEYEKKFTANKGTYVDKETVDDFIKDNNPKVTRKHH